MDSALRMVEYASPSSPSFQTVVTSAYDFENTLSRLKQAIVDSDMWLIHEINPQMLLERAGYAIQPARQLLFFHPRYVVRLLTTDPSAVLEIPLKLVVMQLADGSVAVRHADVQAQLGRYPGVESLAVELATIMQSMVATIRATQ